MIVILGEVVALEEHIDEVLRLALEHVHRSRAEPGCLSHEVARDAENPLRLLFTERWADLDAVRTHFAVPASNDFVAAATRMASQPPEIRIYEATPARP